jgi:glycine cleavage system H protein
MRSSEMANIPADLWYTEEHEWVRKEDDLYVVGITDYAQDSLGDIVYVEVGAPGESLQIGRPFGVVESVKAASDLFAPLSGEIVEANSELENAPEQANTDPYGSGWMIKIRASDPGELDKLMDAAAYEAFVGQE